MANPDQNTVAAGRAKARRTALIVGLVALAVYAGFLLSVAIK
ncbi:MAG: hypothetical protein ACRERV_02560 [Methylococcales bacterium]